VSLYFFKFCHYLYVLGAQGQQPEKDKVNFEVKAEVAAEGIQGWLGDQLTALLRRSLPSMVSPDPVCSSPDTVIRGA
jgi:hypothetical protein